MAKPQRIRDPLHDIIPFDDGEFERTMWAVVETAPFQRLRRIKQLGFSEFTFPGATHTRFAHSIGVFHTARQLLRVIEEKVPKAEKSPSKANVALAAALVHDVGHGMFSHAFEKVGGALGLDMVDHERVSERLILDSPITGALESGRINPKDVATVIGRKGPGDLYDAIVSSQFDADRLDYMRRDRLMAGVQSGGIDFPWLLDNLEVEPIPSSSDEAGAALAGEPPKIKTFVLGPKAILAGEQYVLALFQLYPTIFFHKATRAAETVFKALMVRLLRMVRDGNHNQIGLPRDHPIVRFAETPSDLEATLALDDTVFWGSLGMMASSYDPGIARFAKSLQDRLLPKAIDLGGRLEYHLQAQMPEAKADEVDKARTRIAEQIGIRFDEWNADHGRNGQRIMLDVEDRDPYSQRPEKGALNRIHIKSSTGEISDIADRSPMIAALRPFILLRAYTYDDDREAKEAVETIAAEIFGEAEK